MRRNGSVLRNRLEKVWGHANFTTFFQNIVKRPVIDVKKGTTIFNEGDRLKKLYFIKKGFVKLYRISENGKESTIYLFGSGHILGIRALLSEDECAKHNAQAMTDLQIITISRSDFLDAISSHPEYLVDLMQLIADRLTYTERKLEGFILTDATARVANFLSDCALRFGKKKNGHIALPFPMTHQRIAEFVGSFRETVTLALHKLEEENVLMVEKGAVTIVDPKKLKDYTL